MKNILFVNFDRTSHFLSMGHVVHSLSVRYPEARISLLLEKESLREAKIIKGISEYFVLDRAHIAHMKKSKIFGVVLGLREFHTLMGKVQEVAWDQIINFSRDRLGSLIHSFLGPVLPSTPQIQFLKDVYPHLPLLPLGSLEQFHFHLQVPWAQEEVKIHTHPDHNQKAHQHFVQLRKKLGEEKGAKKIIGLSLGPFQEDHPVPLPQFLAFAKALLERGNFYPVLLHSPSGESRNLAETLSSQLGTPLLSVEGEAQALASVLMNIDLLVTSEQKIKNIADLVSTPVVEISPGGHEWTVGQGNLILGGATVNATDLWAVLNFFFGQMNLQDLTLSPGLSLYQTQRDDFGPRYHPLAGDIHSSRELSQQMMRLYIHALFSASIQETMVERVAGSFNKKDILEWMDREKEKINLTVRGLLGTLRTLRTNDQTTKRGREFIQGLDYLLQICEEPSLVALPCLIFKSGLTAVTQKSAEENVKQMEVLLFKLKKQIQILTKLITQLNSSESHLGTRKPTEGDHIL